MCHISINENLLDNENANTNSDDDAPDLIDRGNKDSCNESNDEYNQVVGLEIAIDAVKKSRNRFKKRDKKMLNAVKQMKGKFCQFNWKDWISKKCQYLC